MRFEKDYKILEVLRSDSRIEYLELSKKIGLTGNAIKNRIKKLEESGIIERYTIAFDYSKLKLEFYNLQIKFTDSNFSKFKKFLKEDQKVKYFYKHLGNPNWDLDIGLLVQNSKDLREFLMKLRKNFGGVTEIHELYLVPETTKENILPDIVFQTSNNL